MFEIKFPDFSNNVWEKALNEAEGYDKDFIQCLARAANLIENFDTNATPERLAWAIFWNHILNSIEGARAAVIGSSESSLLLIKRQLMELELLIFGIMRPLIEKFENAEEQVSERLAAYTAWCLCNDINVYERLLDRRNIDQTWDNSVQNKIAEDPEDLERFERIYGKIELESPEELKEGRKKFEEKNWEAQEKLKELAKQLKLEYWIDKLSKNKIRAKRKEEKWIRNYYDLIGEDEKSIMDRLIHLGTPHAYSIYESASNFTHVSSLDQVLLVSKDKIYTRTKLPIELMSPTIKNIAETCNDSLVKLFLLKQVVL